MSDPVVALARAAVRSGGPVAMMAWARGVLRPPAPRDGSVPPPSVLVDGRGAFAGSVCDTRGPLLLGRNAPTVLLRRGVILPPSPPVLRSAPQPRFCVSGR